MQNWTGSAAGAAVMPDGSIERFGPNDAVFALASITKLYTAMAALVAHEEGTLDLDDPFDEAGFSAADLLAHSAGIAPDERRSLAPPAARRIYSTAAYDILADRITDRAGMPFDRYAAEAVARPLGMTRWRLEGSAGAGASGSVDDVLALLRAWQAPILVDERTRARAVTPHHPTLDGVLPGYGRQSPNPWGLGPEIRGQKSPHWTSPNNDPATFGHFGRTGTVAWVDPGTHTSLIALSDQEFGPWAIDAWPLLSTDVLNSASD